MYCLALNPNHLEIIKNLNYIPVGLGDKKFSDEWISDKTKSNISHKNKFYGEYTFHYWLWKNDFANLDDNWIGFCQYRKFWSLKNVNKKNLNIDYLKSIAIKTIPENYQCEAILGDPIMINQFRPMKFLKRGFKIIIKKPIYLFSKKKRNIKFHFDFWHGEGNLSKAINLLDKENKNDFDSFVNDNVSFNPHNMFICNSKKILYKYYEAIFPWLEKCEKVFGFENLSGYGQVRIYGFLAERFMSYWFQKNTNFKTMPIIFHDINENIK